MKEYIINEDKLYNKLGWCGCSDNDVSKAFQIVINEFLNEENVRGIDYNCYYTDIVERTGLDITLVQIILLELDKLRITDHGSSVRGSWLHDPTKLDIICGESEDDNEA
jgi:hypothetical protein